LRKKLLGRQSTEFCRVCDQFLKKNKDLVRIEGRGTLGTAVREHRGQREKEYSVKLYRGSLPLSKNWSGGGAAYQYACGEMLRQEERA